MLSDTLENTKFWWKHKINWLPVTASTNDDLKALWRSKDFCHTLEVADVQTQGRGQYERKWASMEAGQCLMFSFTVDVKEYAFPISMMAGAALAIALESVGLDSKNFWLKWPNDVWIKGQKLAGILTESTAFETGFRSVVGIGLNILPLPVSAVNATSLKEAGIHVSREAMLEAFCKAWDKIFEKKPAELTTLWIKYAGEFWKREFVLEVPSEDRFLASPLFIEPDGSLIVKTSKGQERKIISATLFPNELQIKQPIPFSS